MGQALNPYLPSYEYIPDGEPHIFGDRLYIYGSHDRFGGKAFCENDYVCWSAPLDDLSAWRYEGIIYTKNQDPKNRRFTSNMYAPDCCKGNDGRYYLYYGCNGKAFTGVAVCDSPCGKFEFYGHVRHKSGKLYGHEKGDFFPFDPGVMNDGGRIFLCSGFSPAGGLLRLGIDLMSPRKGALGNQCLELEEDMLTVKSVKQLIPGAANSKGTGFEGHEFYEASSMRKFGDKYYLIYSSVLSHELCCAISDRPDGGYKFGGTLHSNADIGYNGNTEALNFWGNNHGSIACVNGEYYIFGHRQTNRRETNRQGVAEKIIMNSAGHFSQAEMTCCGLNGGPLGKGKYEAGIACNLFATSGAEKSVFFRNKAKCEIYPYITQTGEDRESDPCQYIRNMREGSIAGYKYFECDCSEIIIEARGQGRIEILTDLNSPPLAVISVDSVDFAAYTAPFAFEGVKPVYLRYRGDMSADILSLELR